MKKLQLTNSKKVVLVDDDDFTRLNLYNWGLSILPSGYQITRNDDQSIQLSWFILNYKGPNTIDHKDRNYFNNQKCNLREATRLQQSTNRSKQGKWRGVYPNGRKFMARITINGVRTSLGNYDTPEIAAKVWDTAAKKFYGEFHGELNFPEK